MSTSNPDTPLIAIVGPTAVGKSALSLRLAAALDGEIVSADSRQIYRGMDIGTAKVTRAEQAQVRHHLLDVVNPDEVLTLAQYRQMAQAAIADIAARGKTPLLVGGTGLYVWALAEGWAAPEVPPNEPLRQQLEREAEARGALWLHGWLAALDPQAAREIDARNVRRVIRALEVCLMTGRPISAQRVKQRPPYRTLFVGLTMERAALYRRVDERIDAMLAQGLLQEVQALLAQGYAPTLPAMSGVGYRQLIAHLHGECTLAEAVAAIRQATRRFIRRQANWFRLDDSRIHWFDAIPDPYSAVETLAHRFLRAS